jgi:hypothetical protein
VSVDETLKHTPLIDDDVPDAYSIYGDSPTTTLLGRRSHPSMTADSSFREGDHPTVNADGQP